MPASQSRGKIFYRVRPAKEGQPPFVDIRLPGGTIIRQVDETLHRKALSNAAKALKQRRER